MTQQGFHFDNKFDNMFGKKPDHPCGKCHEGHHDHCVKNILLAILEAQRKANIKQECTTSCKQSIEDLLNKKQHHTKNTIPFILYCGCEPFKGTGIRTYSCPQSRKEKFQCIESFIFKVKHVKDDCAVLELLAFHSDLNKSCPVNSSTPCHQINHKYVHDLVATGICINVDLNKFHSITCLDAIYL